MFGSAESEHPRLTDGEIISEEFQSVCVHNPLVNVAEGRTDGQTDKRHVVARPRFAVKCIAR